MFFWSYHHNIMSFVTAELDFDDLEIEQISRRVAGEDAARFQDDRGGQCTRARFISADSLVEPMHPFESIRYWVIPPATLADIPRIVSMQQPALRINLGIGIKPSAPVWL